MVSQLDWIIVGCSVIVIIITIGVGTYFVITRCFLKKKPLPLPQPPQPQSVPTTNSRTLNPPPPKRLVRSKTKSQQMSKTQIATSVVGGDEEDESVPDFGVDDRRLDRSAVPVIPSTLETDPSAEPLNRETPNQPPIGKLIIREKIIQDCVAKRVADIIAKTNHDEMEEKSFPLEIDENVANRFRQQVKQGFEMRDWNKAHMPKHCEYKLFKAPNPYMRFYIMEFLRNHADSILRAHGYTINPPQCEVTKEGSEWIRSDAVTNEVDGFVKCRAWMLENWSFFTKYPDNITCMSNFGNAQDVPLIYMAAMKESVNTPEKLDFLLKLMLDKAANYLDSTPKREWQVENNYPMKVISVLFEEGNPLPVCACSISDKTQETIDAPSIENPPDVRPPPLIEKELRPSKKVAKHDKNTKNSVETKDAKKNKHRKHSKDSKDSKDTI